jgi:hypothetical protein
MATVQLLGRGTYGPDVPMGPWVSPLWMYVRMPPAQNSIIIYNNGEVVERSIFENAEIKDPSVRVFILGGTRYRTEVGSFEYDALTAAGYTWLSIAEPNTYTEDYEDSY